MHKSSASQIIQFLLQPQANYAEAKKQAQQLDEALGFNCEPIEKKLTVEKSARTEDSKKQFWIGLDLQSLQTPYSEFVSMIEVIQPHPGQVWIDLGAGYGRLGLVLGFLQPDVQFKGYEFVSERVAEGNRIFKKWQLPSCSLQQIDLVAADLELNEGDVFFIYDFGSQNDIYLILEKLRLVALQKPIRVIARGRGIKNWILMDFPWLSQINAPRHFDHWSLFCS